MIDQIMWNAKYRPTSLDEVALEEDNRKLFQEFIEQGEIPHLLLSGPAGCGKTTVAQILIDETDASSIELNASDTRGIDTVREDVKTFAQGKMSVGTGTKIVLLDEADSLTREAQSALRRIMEKYSGNCRFILTCNYKQKIIDPIESRCTPVAMREIPKKERFKVLRRILDEEGVEADNKTVASYAKTFRDMRRMISAAQRSVLTHGELVPAQNMTVTGEELFEWCKNGQYGMVRDASQQRNFNHRGKLEDLYYAIPDDFKKANSWRAKLNEAINVEQPADPVIHFCGTCAALMASLE